MSSLRVITNSEQKTRRRCPREHYYAYILGIRSTEDVDALLFGTAWHRGLEAWWMGQDVEDAIAAAVEGIADPYEAVKLRVLLRGYDARWGNESHSVVGVEREFRAPVINPDTGAPSRTFVLGGKIDVLLKRAFMEHKTTSEDIGFGSVYWRTLAIDSQVSTYYAGAKSLGEDVERCIYDVVKKPTIKPRAIPVLDANGFKQVFDRDGNRVYLIPKPRESASKADGYVLQTREEVIDGKKKAIPVLDAEGFKIVLDAAGERVFLKTKPRETGSEEDGYVLQTRPETPEEFEARLLEDVMADPDRYYQRGEVVRLEEEERDAQRDTWQLTRAMREDELAGRHPRNADACKRFGRLCPYFDVCTGVASLDDSTRFQRVENVHQELSP